MSPSATRGMLAVGLGAAALLFGGQARADRLELADGDTGNWILYDDDSVTPLLTFNVRDKAGAVIVQQAGVPSRRSRGT